MSRTIEGAVTRTCYESAVNKSGKFPATKKLTFVCATCSYEQAVAHLQINAPHGFVVSAQKQNGPLGGWGKLWYFTKVSDIHKHSKRSLHIAYAEVTNG